MIERDKEYYNQKIGELYAVIENQEKIIRDLQETLEDCEIKGLTEFGIANMYKERIDRAINCLENYKNKRVDIPIMEFIVKIIANNTIKILKGGNDE